MLRGVMLWLRFRRLNGRTVGIGLRDGCYIGVRETRVSLLGITGRLCDDSTMFTPWSDGHPLQWGESVERAVAARVAGRDGSHAKAGRLFSALMRAEMAGGGPDDEPEAESKPAISPEEVQRILAEERSA